MIKPASKEFLIGLGGVEGTEKFTPRAMTLNGVRGRHWTRRKLIDGAWVHQGKQFVRRGAAEVEVTAAFDGEQS